MVGGPASSLAPMAAPSGSRLRLRRTWPQRFVLGINVLVVLACGLAAAAVWYANNRLGSLERVVISHVSPATAAAGNGPGPSGGGPSTSRGAGRGR